MLYFMADKATERARSGFIYIPIKSNHQRIYLAGGVHIFGKDKERQSKGRLLVGLAFLETPLTILGYH